MTMMIVDGLLALHVAGGTVALLSGLVPMLSRKGGRLHRRAGDIYVAAMLVVGLSAVVLAAVSGKPLLLVLGVFTLFLVFGGVRAIGFLRGRRPSGADHVVVALTAAFGVWLVWRGAGTGDVTSLFFGLLASLLAWQRQRLLRDPTADWLVAHLSSMGAAYIATATAFLVVNIAFLPRPFVFIAPTFLGVPLIVWAASRYRRPDPASRLA